MLAGLLVLTVVAAAVFAWTNGVHDAANAIAAPLTTGALTPRFALFMAAVLNGLGALLGIDVALTISARLVDVPAGTAGVRVVLVALLVGVGWNMLTWWLGLPSSSSHALIAGLVGAGLVAGARIDLGVATQQVILPTLLSPIAGFGLAWLAVTAVGSSLDGLSRRLTVRRLRLAQSLSAAAVALAHGLQDGQKTMAAVVLALVAAGRLGPADVPTWVRMITAMCLAVGTAAGGWPLVRTLGRRVARLDPLDGFAAQTASAAILYVAGGVGAPVSSTHAVTAAVAGAGAANGVRLVRWLVLRRILLTWLVTPLACGTVAALLQAVGG